MSFGGGEFDTLNGDEQLVQFRIGLWHKVNEPCVQTTGSYSLYLFGTG